MITISSNEGNNKMGKINLVEINTNNFINTWIARFFNNDTFKTLDFDPS